MIVLAEAAKNPTKEIRQKSIRTAIKIVKETIAELPDTSRLAQECDRLLPAIAKLYHNPGDTMTEDTQVVDLDKISAEVTNAVNDLPASLPPDQEGIKELVERLQKMIEGDENLKPEDKAEALKQVQALAEAAKNPLVEKNKRIAESAMTRLTGKVEEAPEATNFSQACKSLLPQINTIFGLGN